MAKPLNEQNIIDRVEAEKIEENETPIASAFIRGVSQRTVHTASGVANEAKGYYGTAGNPGTL